MPFVRWRQFQVGFGQARAGPIGLLKDNPNAAKASVAATGETDLMSITLKANALYKNGVATYITAWGNCANNGNNKRIRLYVGGTVVFDSAAVASTTPWYVEVVVLRVLSALQTVLSFGIHNNAAIALAITTLTKDETADIVIKCTGLGTADNDVTQLGQLVEVMTQ